MTAFGCPVQFFSGDAEDGTTATTAQEDMDLVRRTLLGFNDGGNGFLRIYRPKPTAAFSPRDTTLPSYAEAAAAMQTMGFEPVERRAGGLLAVYDESALIVDLVAPHPDPREHVLERFRQLSSAIAAVLIEQGISASVGAIDGEYCPGDYSVNGGGRIKLAGLAQRIGRCGYHLGVVLSVTQSQRARVAVTEAYRILGLQFDPATFGAMSDYVETVCFTRIRAALRDRIAATMLAG
jgi:lipoate-protein ligase A